MRSPQAVLDCMQRRLLTLTVTLLATLASPAGAERIVAIGDVHGSIEGLTKILGDAGLIDGANRWSGGTATLVQTGDLTDRGEHVRAVLDLMMALEEQAAAAGGRVVALLGNHEVNNLVSYFGPDATLAPDFTAIVSHFADPQSQTRLRKTYADWRVWQARYPQCAADRSRREWIAEHPPGYLEYVQALAPDGLYGAWLRKRQVAAQIGDTIFLHGGLSPDPPEQFPTESLEAINRQVALELERFDRDKSWLVEQGVILEFSQLGEIFCSIRNEVALLAVTGPEDGNHQARLEEIYARLPQAQTWLSFHGDGPIWFRGWAYWTDEEGPDQIARVAEAYGAKRFVAGHTPQTGTILARFDDRVFLIDTAMVFGKAAGGRPAALEIVDGKARAIYEREEPALAPVAATQAASQGGDRPKPAFVWLDADGKPLPFSNAEEVTEFLRTAKVESMKEIPVGVTKPRRLVLARGGVRANATFRDINVTGERKRLSTGGFAMFFRDHYINEVAAFELSRLMGLGTIPPAVEREINSEPGSVQMWLEGAMMETTRREKKIEPPDRLRFTRQFYDMRVFDNLINNTDRNSGNILLDADWNMWWIDHTRSFSRAKELPAPQDVLGCSHELYEAIKALDEDEVTELLRPYLPMPEIRALHERRKRLLALIEERIAARGADWVLFNYGDPDNRVRIDYGESADGA